jgi:hypothetical protein
MSSGCSELITPLKNSSKSSGRSEDVSELGELAYLDSLAQDSGGLWHGLDEELEPLSLKLKWSAPSATTEQNFSHGLGASWAGLIPGKIFTGSIERRQLLLSPPTISA